MRMGIGKPSMQAFYGVAAVTRRTCHPP